MYRVFTNFLYTNLMFVNKMSEMQKYANGIVYLKILFKFFGLLLFESIYC